jgi:transcriptional regulator with XRE-family HTH domain
LRKARRETNLRGADATVIGVPGVNFAERLNRLFELVLAPDGKPYTNEAVVNALAAREDGLTISKGYLSELRNGKKLNPTLRHIEALADFFGVDPAYFVADEQRAEEIQQQIQTLRDLGQAGVRSIALRARDAAADNLSLIEAILDQIVRHQQGRQHAEGDAEGGPSQ